MKYTVKNGLVVDIREAEVCDAEAVIEYMKLIATQTNNLMREPDEVDITLEFEKSFIEKNKQSKDDYLLTVWHNDTLISVTGFHGSSLRRMKHKANLGISILKEYRGYGIGVLLMNLLIEKAKEYGKVKLELEVRSDNEAAIHVYEKVGFYKEGIRKNSFNDQGKLIDLLFMGKDL